VIWSFARRRLAVPLAVLAALSVPLGHKLFKRSRPGSPQSTAEFLRFLQAHGVEQYRIQFDDILTNDPDGGAYLIAPGIATDPRGLMRAVEKAEQWNGILFVKPLGGFKEEEIQLNLQAWGEYGLCRGGFFFFGDPYLLHRVIEVLPEGPSALDLWLPGEAAAICMIGLNSTAASDPPIGNLREARPLADRIASNTPEPLPAAR
jgi:hypothetical protein